MPALIGLIPQTVRPTRLQEANALLALTRSIASVAGPAIAGVLIVAAGPGEAIAVDAATFAVSALCLARMRAEREPAARGAARATSRSSPGCARAGTRCARARGCAWGLVAMSVYHVFVLPGGVRARPGARRRASSTAPRAGRRSSPASGSAASWATCVALRIPLRRPVFVAALALVGASTQAAIIGSGLGTAGIAALELLAGICVALFFTLWDMSIQEQVPRHAVSRVSAYDFTVSMGLMPLGMAMGGPIADAARPAGDADRA